MEHLKQCLEHSQPSEMSANATTVKAETAVKGGRQGVSLQGRGGQLKQHQQKRDTPRFVTSATPDF